MFWERGTKEDGACCHSDGGPPFSHGVTVLVHVTSGRPPLPVTAPGVPSPPPGEARTWPAPSGGDSYSDRPPARPVPGGPPAKFVRPQAFLWEDAGLSSCSLAMIKVRLVPKTLSFHSLILAFSNQMATLYFQL